MSDAALYALSRALKWLGWRLIRLADRWDDPPPENYGGTD